mmetsp:Transcript_51462/g.129956  ORF Transcript_51462/g.129956 Transcript_51462/m.129956 type:complete len:322 (-) Transcript_51462:41-1006(-)
MPRGRGVPREAVHAQAGDGQKPDDHDGASHHADDFRATSLHQEDQEQDRNGDRNLRVLPDGRRDALQGTQHGDRRGDAAVARDEGDAEHGQEDDCRLRARREGAAARRGRLGALEDRLEHREGAAFAMVAHAHHQAHVLDAYHQGQHPEDHGKGVHDVPRSRLGGVEHSDEDAREGVQRRGADVAEDHARRPEHEEAEAARVAVQQRCRFALRPLVGRAARRGVARGGPLGLGSCGREAPIAGRPAGGRRQRKRPGAADRRRESLRGLRPLRRLGRAGGRLGDRVLQRGRGADVPGAVAGHAVRRAACPEVPPTNKNAQGQ